LQKKEQTKADEEFILNKKTKNEKFMSFFLSLLKKHIPNRGPVIRQNLTLDLVFAEPFEVLDRAEVWVGLAAEDAAFHEKSLFAEDRGGGGGW
jgi:hypothetical protein